MDTINIDIKNRLTREFYQQDGLTLAKNLLGKLMVRRVEDEYIVSKIVETEAYLGPEDKACHGYNNRRTNRTEVMFSSGGKAYVYLIYGMYNCFNVVSGEMDKPEAVLIRAVEVVKGIEIVQNFRKIKSNMIENYTNGPGKLCMAMNINRDLNGEDLISSDELFIVEGDSDVDIVEKKRINIDYAEEYVDKLWRFYIKDNPFVSKK